MDHFNFKGKVHLYLAIRKTHNGSYPAEISIPSGLSQCHGKIVILRAMVGLVTCPEIFTSVKINILFWNTNNFY